MESVNKRNNAIEMGKVFNHYTESLHAYCKFVDIQSLIYNHFRLLVFKCR